MGQKVMMAAARAAQRYSLGAAALRGSRTGSGSTAPVCLRVPKLMSEILICVDNDYVLGNLF